MPAFLLYRLSGGLLRLLAWAGLDDRELEIAVLRHQLRVLTRAGKRPGYTTADRGRYLRFPSSCGISAGSESAREKVPLRP